MVNGVFLAGRVLLIVVASGLFQSVEADYNAINWKAGTFFSNGFSGDGGQATAALLKNPTGSSLDTTGVSYISDNLNYRIRKVDTSGIITTVFGTSINSPSGNNGAATAASGGSYCNVPDSVGNLFIADFGNSLVRRVSGGMVYSFAGVSSTVSTDGIPATSSGLYVVAAVAVDSNGGVYMSGYQYKIRKVVVSTGKIYTVAGTGTLPTTEGAGLNGDGGQATAANVGIPWGIFVDTANRLYFGSYNGYFVRRVDLTTGIISFIAGNGVGTNSGDGGPATSAGFYPRNGVAADTVGNVFISGQDGKIRKVDSSGIINIFSGTGTNRGSSYDGTEAIKISILQVNSLFIRGDKLTFADFSTYVVYTISLTPSTYSPSYAPSCRPTRLPTIKPTSLPTVTKTTAPSALPSTSPSAKPTLNPSVEPSNAPTYSSTLMPSALPSTNPTEEPSTSTVPTKAPSICPTDEPSVLPSTSPTVEPSTTPTVDPSSAPTVSPTLVPSALPSTSPSVEPTVTPTFTLTVMPTVLPTYSPTNAPTVDPSIKPSAEPSLTPSIVPSTLPSLRPTVVPSPVSAAPSAPTRKPSALPSVKPSRASASTYPTVAPTLAPTAAPTTHVDISFNSTLILMNTTDSTLTSAGTSAVVSAVSTTLNLTSGVSVVNSGTVRRGRRLSGDGGPPYNLLVVVSVQTSTLNHAGMNGSALYHELKSVLMDAVESRDFMSALSVSAHTYSAYGLYYVSSVNVSVSEYSIVPVVSVGSDDDEDDAVDGLSEGAVAGIVVGGVVLLLMVVMCGYFGLGICRNKAKRVGPYAVEEA